MCTARRESLGRVALEEVGLAGFEGCSLERLWELVAARMDDRNQAAICDANAPESSEVDGAASASSASGTANAQPVATSANSKGKGKARPCLSEEDKDAAFAALVAAAPVDLYFARGTVVHPTIRANGTEERAKNQPKLTIQQETTLAEALAEHGGEKKLRAVANISLRDRMLLGGRVERSKVPRMSYYVLMGVGKARAKGVTQAALAKILDIDPRSIFTFIKRLITLELVQKFPVVADRCRTHNLVLWRYCDRASPEAAEVALVNSSTGRVEITPENELAILTSVPLLRKAISLMLEQAVDHTLLLFDIKYMFSTKKYRRRIAHAVAAMAEEGYVERFNVDKDRVNVITETGEAMDIDGGGASDIDEELEDDGESDNSDKEIGDEDSEQQESKQSTSKPQKAKKGRHRGACVRLIKPYVMEQVNKEVVTVAPRSTSQTNIDMTLPLDYQVSEIVRASGDRGITERELNEQVGGMEKKMMDKVLTMLLAMPGPGKIRKVAEFEGRERRYRYFTAATAAARAPKTKREQTVSPAAATEASVIPRTTRSKGKEPASAVVKLPPSPPVVEIPVRKSAVKKPTIATLPVETTFGPTPESSPSPALKMEPAFDTNEVVIVSNVERDPRTGPVKRDSANSAEMRRNLVRMLNEQKVLVVATALSTEYMKRFADAGDRRTVDNKTLARAGTTLEKLGLAVCAHIAVPRPSGTFDTRLFILHPSISRTGPEVRAKINEMQERDLNTLKLRSAPAVPVKDSVRISRLGQAVEAAAKQDREIQRNMPGEFWLRVAAEYGWCSGKMMRARILHAFIWTWTNARAPIKAAASGEDLDDESNWTFHASIFFRDIPISCYLRSFGHFERTEHFDAYFRSSAYKPSTPLGSLPKKVAAEIFDDLPRYRRHLKLLLETLHALGLIRPVNTDNVRDAMYFVIATTVQLRNYRSKELEILQDFQLKNGGTGPFWLQLQDVCLAAVANSNEKEEEELEENQGYGDDGAQDEPFVATPKSGAHLQSAINTICTRRAWGIKFYISLSKTQALDKHIGPHHHTPLSDPARINEISNEVDLPVPRVRHYYRQYLHSHNLPLPPPPPRLLTAKNSTTSAAAASATVVLPPHRPLHEQYSGSVPIQLLRSADQGKSPAATQMSGIGVDMKFSLSRAIAALKSADHMQPMQQQQQIQQSFHASPEAALATGEQPRFHPISLPLLEPQSSIPSATVAVPDVASLKQLIAPFDPFPQIAATNEMKRKRQTKADKAAAEDVDEEKATAEVDAEHSPQQRRRRPRINWTEETDIKIMCINVVAMYRQQLVGADDTRSQWILVCAACDGQHDEYRRRKNQLMKKPLRELHDRLNALWPTLRETGIAEGRMADSVAVPTKEAISGEVKYLFANKDATLPEVATPAFTLPNTLEELLANYELVETKPRSSKSLQELIDAEKTQKNSMELRYMQVPTLGMASAPTEKNAAEEAEALKSAVKMCVLLPDDEFDTKEAQAMFEAFPADHVDEAITQARNENLLVDNKTTGHRIPGRTLALSKRVGRLLDGVYPPNLQKQARQAHEKILTCGRRGELFQYHPSAGAGTVCALLSLLAQNRIEPQIEFGDVVLQQTVRHTTMDEPPLTLMFELLELDDRGQDGGDVDMNDETSDDVKATLLERVQQSGRTGMALTTLIEEAEDKQIVVKAANMLLAAGDLRMVGQLQHRFVASTFESDWYRPRVVRTVVEESSTAAVTKVADAASGFAVARPWISATGTFMPVVFQKLANAVLLALVNKPITSMSQLRSRFETILNRCELVEILHFLMSKKCIVRRMIDNRPYFNATNTFFMGSVVRAADADLIHKPLAFYA